MANTPLLTMFPCCGQIAGAAGGLDNAYVIFCGVSRADRHMVLKAHFAAAPSEIELREISGLVKEYFRLSQCTIIPYNAKIQPEQELPAQPVPAE